MSPIIVDPLAANCSIDPPNPVVPPDVEPFPPGGPPGPPPITPPDSGFPPSPGEGCQCTEAELYATWKMNSPLNVILLATIWPTVIPDGYTRHSACLRFVKVSDGVITDTFSKDVSATAQAYLLTIAPESGNYCYAIQFSGYRFPRRTIPTGWTGSEVDFRIYNIVCEN